MLILGMNTIDSMMTLSLMEDRQILSGLYVNEKKKTAAMLIPYIDYILKQADKEAKDLDLISICAGPGSYTSLRIGYSTAKTMCIVNNIQLVEVSRFRMMVERFLEYNRVGINPTNLNILSVLPTTYQKIMSQSFFFDQKTSNMKESSRPSIKSMASVFEVYNELHTVIIGELKKHKKADEFTNITNLENYFEYNDWGDSSSIIARIGFKMFSEGTMSDPRKAEPMYLQSPF